MTSDFLLTSAIHFSTFSLNFGASLSVPLYAVVFIFWIDYWNIIFREMVYMLPHITSEMLRDSVMLRAGREPHDSWALPAFENWNFWKKAENCKQQQKKWSHLLHIQDGRFRVFPYHFRKLWIKEELWAYESDRCMCEIRDDQFSHTFPFSDFISEIPLLYIVSL